MTATVCIVSAVGRLAVDSEKRRINPSPTRKMVSYNLLYSREEPAGQITAINKTAAFKTTQLKLKVPSQLALTGNR